MERIVVFGDGPLLALAEQWAECGLIADSLWVLTTDCAGSPMPDAGPRCRRLPSGEEHQLLDHLAREEETVSLRVLWTRREACGPTADLDLAGMEAIDGLLRRQARNVARIDLVAGQVDGLPRLPSKHAAWETLILGAEDSAVPHGIEVRPTDPTPQLLHAACVLGGVLGGSMTPPKLAESGGQQTQALDVFSRLVVGRQALTQSMDEFLGTRLPLASALDLRPAQHTDELSARIVTDAHDRLRSYGGITYSPPATMEFVRRPKISAGEHIQRFRAFVNFLFLKSKPFSRTEQLAARLADLLEFSDMGSELERPEKGVIEIVNFFSEDAAAVDQLRQLWDVEATQREETLPAFRIWQELLDLCTGLVDGGRLPQDVLPVISRGDRRIVATLEQIQGAPDQVTEDGIAADPGVVVQTAGVTHEPLRHPDAERVAGLVRDHIDTASPALQGTGSIGSRVTSRLAARVDELDQEIRESQRQSLSPGAGGSDRSLLGDLRAEVAADSVAAALEADRSYRLSIGELDQITPLPGASFWFWAVGGAAAGGSLAGASFIWGPEWSSWLLANTGLSIGAPALQVIASIVGAVILVSPFFGYWRRFLAYLERGQRQLEARELLFRRAVFAHREHLRLRAADRILTRWRTILRGLYPLTATPLAQAAPTPATAVPLALQSATINPRPADVTKWITNSAAPTSWRGEALRGAVELFVGELTKTADSGDPLSRLLEDDGRPGGPLDEFARQFPTMWQRWFTGRRGDALREFDTQVWSATQDVALPNGQSESPANFLGAISGQHRPARNYQRPVDPPRITGKKVDATAPESEMTADVFASSSQIYHRILSGDPPSPGIDSSRRATVEGPPA